MPIKNTKIRLREGGRIRLGVKKTTAQGKEFPASITTFRITSPHKELLERLAQTYPGTLAAWKGAPTEGQWELMTTASALEVVLPPAEFGFSQFMELWSGGTCERRCDGEWDQIADEPCGCDPDEPRCKPRTRLSVLFPQLDDWTLWRVDTGSWYAAQEMAGVAQLIQMARLTNTLLPARLLLEQRQKKVRLDDGKVETRKFVVPALEVAVSRLELGSGTDESGVVEGPKFEIEEKQAAIAGKATEPARSDSQHTTLAEVPKWASVLEESATKVAAVRGLSSIRLLESVCMDAGQTANPALLTRDEALIAAHSLRAVETGALLVAPVADSNGELVAYTLEADF